MRNAYRAVLAAMILTVASTSFGRADTEPVELDELALNEAELVIAGPEGEATYTPEELESFDTYRMVTTTPWRTEPAVFEGPRLGDLLAAHGLQDAQAIRVGAEDEYSVVIPRDVWAEQPVLVATRVNGKPHTRRERGPIQFVFPMDDHPRFAAPEYEGYWVWMVSRIEAGE